MILFLKIIGYIILVLVAIGAVFFVGAVLWTIVQSFYDEIIVKHRKEASHRSSEESKLVTLGLSEPTQKLSQQEARMASNMKWNDQAHCWEKIVPPPVRTSLPPPPVDEYERAKWLYDRATGQDSRKPVEHDFTSTCPVCKGPCSYFVKNPNTSLKHSLSNEYCQICDGPCVQRERAEQDPELAKLSESYQKLYQEHEAVENDPKAIKRANDLHDELKELANAIEARREAKKIEQHKALPQSEGDELKEDELEHLRRMAFGKDDREEKR